LLAFLLLVFTALLAAFLLTRFLFFLILVIVVASFRIAIVFVLLVDDIHVEFESEGDDLLLYLRAQVEVSIHLLSNILFFFPALFISVLFLIIGSRESLEEVEERVLFDCLGDGLGTFLL
jgi:hypothetical protein